MTTILDFNINGTFNCDGLNGTRSVRIGGGLGEGEVGCESCPRFARCGLSHTSEIATAIRDLPAIKAACKEMGLAEPKMETVTLYDGTKHTGIAIRLKGWRYPVIIDTKSGKLYHDNYNGSWGDNTQLNKLTQLYGVAKATLIARSKGYMIQRSVMANGTIRLAVSGM